MKIIPIIVATLATSVAVLAYCEISSNETLNIVKSGEAKLYCHIGNDYKLINPEKVIDFYEIDGNYYWEFVNGQATNCYLER